MNKSKQEAWSTGNPTSPTRRKIIDSGGGGDANGNPVVETKSMYRGILQQLQEQEPDKDVLFTAIRELTEPAAIKQFYAEYVVWLKERHRQNPSDFNGKTPTQVARENIGYAVTYFSEETRQLWKKSLSRIYHPVFGHIPGSES